MGLSDNGRFSNWFFSPLADGQRFETAQIECMTVSCASWADSEGRQSKEKGRKGCCYNETVIIRRRDDASTVISTFFQPFSCSFLVNFIQYRCSTTQWRILTQFGCWINALSEVKTRTKIILYGRRDVMFDSDGNGVKLPHVPSQLDWFLLFTSLVPAFGFSAHCFGHFLYFPAIRTSGSA